MPVLTSGRLVARVDPKHDGQAGHQAGEAMPARLARGLRAALATAGA